MTGRSDWRPAVIMLALALVLGAAVYGGALGPIVMPEGSGGTPAPAPTPTPPTVTMVHDTCCEQSARLLKVAWTSSERVSHAAVRLEPRPSFECSATLAASGMAGTFGCSGFLPGATPHVATLTLTTAQGRFPMQHRFTTMGDRLTNVKWFTEFEEPTGNPVACAAASCRIVQLYTTGEDKMTATQLLELGRTLNRSKDPGLDPVAIATLLTRLDARNSYHYYRFDTRQEATAAAVYWLLHSGKPVIAITLAGQHAPLVIGFDGTYGQYFADPANALKGVVVMDPQRGDMRPETNRRPDKYRTPEFQTGRVLALEEWYGDEWWLRFAYSSEIRVPGGRVNIERTDGAYPLPHWVGKFVLLVDDDDAEWPPEREGRVVFR